MGDRNGTGRGNFADELFLTRRVLDTVEVVGWPRREAELSELRRLVDKYPTEARDLVGGDTP